MQLHKHYNTVLMHLEYLDFLNQYLIKIPGEQHTMAVGHLEQILLYWEVLKEWTDPDQVRQVLK